MRKRALFPQLSQATNSNNALHFELANKICARKQYIPKKYPNLSHLSQYKPPQYKHAPLRCIGCYSMVVTFNVALPKEGTL